MPGKLLSVTSNQPDKNELMEEPHYNGRQENKSHTESTFPGLPCFQRQCSWHNTECPVHSFADNAAPSGLRHSSFMDIE